jgi:hypothetical protein
MAAALASTTTVIQNPMEAWIGSRLAILLGISRWADARRIPRQVFVDGGKGAYLVVSNCAGSGERLLSGVLEAVERGLSTRPSSSRTLKNQPISGTSR